MSNSELAPYLIPLPDHRPLGHLDLTFECDYKNLGILQVEQVAR